LSSPGLRRQPQFILSYNRRARRLISAPPPSKYDFLTVFIDEKIMITINIQRAPAQRWQQAAIRKAKAAAEANEIEWEYAHIKIELPQGRSFFKLPGHLALVESA
jgi:hypothetical protein